MTLHLTDAITDGSRRVFTRTGGILFVLLLVLQALLVTSLNTVIATEAPPAAADVIGLTLPISGTVAGAVFVATALSNAVYFVVLSRAFARPLSQLSSFPAELYTRRIGRASLTMLVSGFVTFLAIMIGFALLFLPGLFLSACLLFVIFAVGVEDRGVIGALKRSWRLSKGNRLRLVVIVFLTGVVGALVGAAQSLFQVAGAAALGDLAAIGLNSVLFTFVYGIVAAAYRQVADEDGDRGGADTATTAGTGHTPEL
jgi:hypothetical protein